MRFLSNPCIWFFLSAVVVLRKQFILASRLIPSFYSIKATVAHGGVKVSSAFENQP